MKWNEFFIAKLNPDCHHPCKIDFNNMVLWQQLQKFNAYAAFFPHVEILSPIVKFTSTGGPREQKSNYKCLLWVMK